jgi:hypothetical protein
MEFFGVEKVKDLHHDKGVEDEGKVSREDPELPVTIFIVVVTIDKLHPTASDMPANNPILPLAFRPGQEGGGIIRVHVLGNELFSCKD